MRVEQGVGLWWVGLRGFGLALAAASISSCGGGGGGGGSSGGGGTGTTGFVPTPPVQGATLYSDAALLRPMRAGALWVYRGVQASSSVSYASYTRHSAAGSGFTETVFTELGGAGSSDRNVELAGGAVTVRESVAGLPGTTAVSYTELRSPVRVNDQITLLDQLNVALDEDLEGDGRSDRADIGAFSRVVGNEDVSLPEIGRTLTALRVDTTATVRLHLSSRGSPETPLTIVSSTWYAPGIGIVRQASSQPSASGVGAPDTDERLQYWDGVDTGVGLWPSVRTPRPGGSPTLGPWLSYPYSVQRVGDRVFVLTNLNNSADPDQGLVASVLDARGGVIASVEHLGLGLDPNFRPQLMPLGTGAAFAITEPGTPNGGFYLPENLRLVMIDANAQRTLSAPLVSGGLPRTLKAASDGQTVWVAWAETVASSGSYRVMVQRFGADGAPLSAPEQLDTSDALPDRVEVTAAAGRALVVWHLPEFFGERYRHALVPALGAATIGTLADGMRSSSGESARPTPWISSSLAAVTWYRPMDQLNTPPPQQPPLRGVALDAAAVPRRSTTGPADNELLAVPAHDSWAVGLGIDGASLLWAGAGSAVLTADEVAARPYIEWRSFTPGDGALAAAIPTVQRWRNTTPLNAVTQAPLQVNRVVALNDRWLILGHDGIALTVAVLHR